MKLRRGELQVFGVSFLDVLSCALGGVLLLLILVSSSNTRRFAEASKDWDKTMVSIVGVKGDLEGVAFVFDTSGSMDTPRFEEYSEFLKILVLKLDFKRFNVIQFGSDVDAWNPSGLAAATPANRRRAASFVRSFKPTGSSTNTLGALQKALNFAGVDTVVLFSDGAPDQDPKAIREWLRRNNSGVAVNTVALGEYFQKQYGEFLQAVAQENGGTFIGR